MGFHADRIDARVRPAATRHFLECLVDVGVFVVEDLSARVRSSALEPVGEAVDRYDAFGTEHERAGHRKHANGAGAPYRDDVATRRANASPARRIVVAMTPSTAPRANDGTGSSTQAAASVRTSPAR
jgi:hypothetical protein